MSIRILQGDVCERLAELPSDSFDCIVTSPPYWGLRDYGTARWEGGSADCDHLKGPLVSNKSGLRNDGREHVGPYEGEKAVTSGMPFRDVCGKCGARRIDNQIGLEPTLTEYLDTMVTVCRELRRVLKPSGTFWLNVGDSYAQSGVRHRNKQGNSGLAPSFGKWAEGTAQTGRKINHGLKPKDLCMVPNRLAVRLQDDGWYVRSEIIWAKPNPMPESVTDRPTSSHEKIWLLTKSERYWYDADAIAEPSITTDPRRPYTSQGAKVLDGRAEWKSGERRDGDNFTLRNARNVWTIASQPYSEAHFATFPPELAERCTKVGCPAGGHVLDPFGGSGTTGMVADRLGRDATLIELNPAYVSLIKNRIAEDAGMFAQVAAE